MLAGLAPGVTATVIRAASPGRIVFGAAAPVPEGFVDAAQVFKGEAELRGFGATAVKSALFESVSTQPLLLRSTAVEFVVAGAAALPSKKFAVPQPTRSSMVARAAAEQGVELPLHPKGVTVLTRATFPPLPLILMGVLSVTSGAGNAAITLLPAASWTSKYCPGAIDPDKGVIKFVADPKLPVPVALVYCNDQPSTETLLVPRLNNSMKSFVYTPPEFPPPPYT